VRWRPGDHVLLRQLFRGRLHTAVPSIVAEDTPELVALWLPPGAMLVRPVGGLVEGWTLEQRRVKRGELRLTRPGVRHSILLFMREDSSLRGWYVNLEEPMRRTELGFDYEDLVLDVWVEPDGSRRLLDEDELEEVVAAGLLSAAEAAAVRAESEQVIASLDRLLPTGWEDWRPDPGWSLPALPERWQAVGSS
jgi:hypothetical protein